MNFGYSLKWSEVELLLKRFGNCPAGMFDYLVKVIHVVFCNMNRVMNNNFDVTRRKIKGIGRKNMNRILNGYR